MVAKKGGSDRVTRSANKPNPISDEDLMEIMKSSNPKEPSFSVDSAEGENEFKPSVDKLTKTATFSLGGPQSGGEPKKKTSKAGNVGPNTKSAKKKKKATSKTAKSVVKRSKLVKATTNEGVAD
eukprot:augustus_masked-scaffold_4-processed-gene-13.12-mRNA-1 protein AED:1.00 eAED:1.00 QI:0/-1/0/0/-1/1/1/0/123